MSRIAVLGAGAWGTALALSFSRQPANAVLLWAHRLEHAESLATDRENRRYLPGHPFPPALTITSDLAHTAAHAEILVAVTPSEHTRRLFGQLAPHLRPGHIIVSATKGLEDATHLRMTEVIADLVRTLTAPGPVLPIGVLSGPSFAQEVASGLPAALTLAFAETEIAAHLQAKLTTTSLRLYRNDDVIGVELGGALKNVIAIAAGAVAGSGLGHNATAALITRGIAEITRLALACGGRRETLAGLSGVGDLVLTCTGALSRNRLVGYELGGGRALKEIVASLGGKVAEGIRTTHAALDLASARGVDMPIATQVAAILRGHRSTVDAMHELMSRASRDE